MNRITLDENGHVVRICADAAVEVQLPETECIAP